MSSPYDVSKNIFVNHPVSLLPVQVGSTHHKKVNATTPDYGKKRFLGEFIQGLPYTFLIDDKLYPLVSVLRSRDPDVPEYESFETFENWAPIVAITSSNPSTDVFDSICIKRLYNAAPSHATNVGLIGAEAHKTLALITDTASRLANCIKSIRRRDIPGVLRSLGVTGTRKRLGRLKKISRKYKDPLVWASRSFLEVSYGWKPLLQDVYDSAKDLAERNKIVPNDVHLHAQAGSYSRMKIAFTSPEPTLRCALVGAAPSKIHVRYDLFLKVVDQGVRTRAGLGLTNPAALAWELLPWSFVVDWFAPIGPYLDSLNSFAGLTFQSGTRCVTREENYTAEIFGSTVSPTTSIKAVINGVLKKEVNFVDCKRFTLSNVPSFPSPFAPQVKRALRADRPIKALALLSSVFGRK